MKKIIIILLCIIPLFATPQVQFMKGIANTGTFTSNNGDFSINRGKYTYDNGNFHIICDTNYFGLGIKNYSIYYGDDPLIVMQPAGVGKSRYITLFDAFGNVSFHMSEQGKQSDYDTVAELDIADYSCRVKSRIKDSIAGVKIDNVCKVDFNMCTMSSIKDYNRNSFFNLQGDSILWQVNSTDKLIITKDYAYFKDDVEIDSSLTVHGTITNGGYINKDTVITLIDDGKYNFPTISVGWADIQCDSVLTEKTWGLVSWNGDGATSLRSNGAKFVSADTDGNYACFYDGGTYAILKNTSGFTQTYSIKYHYHF